MKKILFLQLIFAGIVLHAQNYNPIFLNGPVHFESEQGYMVPYRIDSTLVTDSSVVYKSFDIIRPLDNEVFTLKGASWIGQKIEKFDDGRWLFYNHAGLPVTLNCKKENGESWEMFRYDSVTFLVANVDSTVETHFLGITDSVKYINMQWVDPNNVISYEFTEPLKISKNHGFVNVLDFYSFPFTEVVQHFITGNYISQIMNLAGIEGDMDLGYSNLDRNYFFNIAIGNEFHRFLTSSSNENQDYEYSNWIMKFISKEDSEQIVNASVERCYHSSTFYYGNWNYTRKKDTIEVSYNLQDYSFLNKLALEPLLLDAELYTFLAATSNRKEYSELFLSSRPDTLNWLSWECGGPSFFYAGIGGPFVSYYCMIDQILNELTYCKTTNEEWGTPYDCPSLLPVEEFKNSEITISPNPVNEAFKIEGFDKAAYIEIFNMQGQKVQDFEILPSREINAAAFNTGMYLIKLQLNNKTICKRIWKN